jgi:hypothetical protein
MPGGGDTVVRLDPPAEAHRRAAACDLTLVLPQAWADDTRPLPVSVAPSVALALVTPDWGAFDS